MKHERTPTFVADFRRLAQEHQRQFLEVMSDFNEACERFTQQPTGFRWPRRLRVSPMRSAPGILEMTWSFASPDGRATFEFVKVDGDVLVRLRRVGDHTIYRKP
ncbi:MAG: hypothetical protein U0904_06385 [Candidatus Nanopelagicales bacterium]|nr:hypothetical protein [Candidatus Nanopelagicales bacterium]